MPFEHNERNEVGCMWWLSIEVGCDCIVITYRRTLHRASIIDHAVAQWLLMCFYQLYQTCAQQRLSDLDRPALVSVHLSEVLR